MTKRVVVTGASGHIGFHVANLLVEAGHEVHLLVRNRNLNIDTLEGKGAKVHQADLMNVSSYSTVLDNADALFHLASENTTDTSDEERVISNTYGISKKVLDAAIAGNVKTIIYTSSVVVLGRSSNPKILLKEDDVVSSPESPYVKGKLLAEKYCDELLKNTSADIRRLYPSWVVGNGDLKLTPPHKLIGDFILKGQAFYFSGGISVASVQAVALAHVKAWTDGKPGEKYVLAGDNISFKEFYTLIARHSGRKAPSLFLPKWFIYCAAVGLKLFFGKKSSVDPRYVRSVIGNYSWYNSAKAARELNYNIVSADELLKEAVSDNRKRTSGLILLHQKNNTALKRTQYAPEDVLLVTGFPGWLGNRMVDIFMNGDRFGNNAVDRKIKLLVQPHFKGMISLPSNFEIVYGDITDKNSLAQALKNVKAVYHLAGVIYPKDTSVFEKVNAQGTRNLVDACIDAKANRILFMGTDSICGYGREKRVFDERTEARPYKNYGKSKYAAEKYILDKTKEGLVEGTSLRGFWFFGPFMPLRNLSFFKMFYWKRQIVFGNGKNLRSISHVDNTIDAFLKAEKRKETIGKCYWVGDRKADYTVDEIYSNIAEGLGRKYSPLYVPRFMCELLAVLDSFIGLFGKLNPTIHAAGKFHKDIAGEITAAQRDFDYKPQIGFEEIKKELKEMVQP